MKKKEVWRTIHNPIESLRMLQNGFETRQAYRYVCVGFVAVHEYVAFIFMIYR